MSRPETLKAFGLVAFTSLVLGMGCTARGCDGQSGGETPRGLVRAAIGDTIAQDLFRAAVEREPRWAIADLPTLKQLRGMREASILSSRVDLYPILWYDQMSRHSSYRQIADEELVALHDEMEGMLTRMVNRIADELERLGFTASNTKFVEWFYRDNLPQPTNQKHFASAWIIGFTVSNGEKKISIFATRLLDAETKADELIDSILLIENLSERDRRVMLWLVTVGSAWREHVEEASHAEIQRILVGQSREFLAIWFTHWNGLNERRWSQYSARISKRIVFNFDDTGVVSNVELEN